MFGEVDKRLVSLQPTFKTILLSCKETCTQKQRRSRGKEIKVITKSSGRRWIVRSPLSTMAPDHTLTCKALQRALPQQRYLDKSQQRSWSLRVAKPMLFCNFIYLLLASNIVSNDGIWGTLTPALDWHSYNDRNFMWNSSTCCPGMPTIHKLSFKPVFLFSSFF